ncbi:ABC transporter ATP-binding protein [Diaphorobacter sp.]|uniref:ABC transporter ATP-binding protein n=1 Tax=Diaphorobacter sp. TaxID=1934310 RepID=UPI0028A7596E|nr:ABC transporter ATP-binding protein [Diaphorobacter sp.]
MLSISALHAYYGKSHVLRGVDVRVEPGEIVALLGRNGSGRSTLAKAVMGLVACEGSVRWQGAELVGQPTYAIAQRGIGYVPESRDIFPGLSVEHNLLLGRKPPSSGAQPAQWTLDDMYALFPSLHARRHVPAGVLSGGEQQMLALGRTLMGAPQIILVDEPTEGLAPLIVQQVAQFLQTLKARSVGVLLIEQKLGIALDICDRVLVMGKGQIVFSGNADQLRSAETIRREWLEV